MVLLKFRSAVAGQQCEAPVWKQVQFFTFLLRESDDHEYSVPLDYNRSTGSPV